MYLVQRSPDHQDGEPRQSGDMATAIENHTTQRLTIRFEESEDGWITARIDEEPGAISQGRTHAEAYENVLDALHDIRHTPTITERIATRVEGRLTDLFAELRQQLRELQHQR
jgi:mannose/cellobiose epimerase-like protein (N-acyl-D-glucosamine 2-epimerase family)